MTYQAAGNGMTSRRDVDPYGLVYREGTWLLVGWCHLRKEIRSRSGVDRIATSVMAPKPKTPDFERPADFDVRAFASRSPWTFATEPLEEVELRPDPEAPPTPPTRTSAPAPRSTPEGDATWWSASRCGNPDFAVSRVLAAKGAIVVRARRPAARRASPPSSTPMAERYGA